MENQIEIFKTRDNQTEVQVLFEQETVWLSQKQMRELFQTSIPNINMHIKSIYTEEELNQEPTIKDFLIVKKEGSRNYPSKRTKRKCFIPKHPFGTTVRPDRTNNERNSFVWTAWLNGEKNRKITKQNLTEL